MKINETLPELLTGDIVLIRSNKILSKLIRLFTNGIYSHAEIIIKNWDYNELNGAVKIGIRGTDFYRYCKGKNIAILRKKDIIKNGLNYQNEKILATRANSKKGIKYDYWSLLYFQVVYQLFHKWIGRTEEKALKKMYCSEYIAWIFELNKWWTKTPQDLYNEITFEKIFEGKLK